MCNLIIDNGSWENFVSMALVEYMKLETKSHPQPYDNGRIKKGPCIKVTNRCQVPISIEKFYRDPITCDVVNIDKCHIFLGRSWQHDVDATHKGRDNIYVFTWKGKRVATRPIPPPPESTKKVSSLISLCQRLDRNSRASSLEE